MHNVNTKLFWKHPVFFYAVCAVLFLLLNKYVICIAVVHGPSMEPALKDWDIVAVRLWEYCPDTGDIAVTNENNPFGVSLIKRIAAVGGGSYSHDGKNFTVPENAVFLIGDNINSSRDSREIGAVPEPDVRGKVVMKIFPFDEMGFL